MSENTIKQHDNWPYLEFSFKNDDDTPVDCSGYEVSFVAYDWEYNKVIDTSLDSTGFVWVSQTEGTGVYQWQTGDTAVQGQYNYEFKFIRNSDGKKFTLPTQGYFTYSVV